MAVRRFSHIAIQVSDLARSHRFYRDALEFRELTIRGGPTALYLGDPALELKAVFLERDGTQIELQQLSLPDTEELAGFNRLGLAHIGLRVDDVDAVIAAVKEHGGEVIESSRFKNADWDSDVVFVADPDGTWIELIRSAGDPSTPPGEPIR